MASFISFQPPHIDKKERRPILATVAANKKIIQLLVGCLHLPLFLKLFHTLTHTYSLSYPGTPTHPPTHILSLSLSCSFSHTPSHSHSFPLLSTPLSFAIMEPLTKICVIIFVISPFKSLYIKFESYFVSYSRL